MIPEIIKNENVESFEGQATLILINSMGMPICRQIKVQKAQLVDAARYQGEYTGGKKCLQLQYVEKGKRKPCAYRYPEADLALAKGWQEIGTPNEWTCFDSSEFQKMLKQLKNVVYIQQDKESDDDE